MLVRHVDSLCLLLYSFTWLSHSLCFVRISVCYCFLFPLLLWLWLKALQREQKTKSCIWSCVCAHLINAGVHHLLSWLSGSFKIVCLKNDFLESGFLYRCVARTTCNNKSIFNIKILISGIFSSSYFELIFPADNHTTVPSLIRLWSGYLVIIGKLYVDSLMVCRTASHPMSYRKRSS